jgi:regulator of sigma E protease
VIPPVVGEVVTGSAAASSALRPGDRVTAIDGRSVTDFADIARYVQIRAGQRVTIEATRGGVPFTTDVTVGTDEQRDRFGNRYRIGRLGVRGTGTVDVRPVGLLRAPVVAVKRTGEIVRMMVETLGQVISGRRSVKELGGPVSIAKVSGEQMALGLDAFVFFVALVSINLGFINLLPVPMLDGGHLLFYAIEAVRRRPLGRRPGNGRSVAVWSRSWPDALRDVQRSGQFGALEKYRWLDRLTPMGQGARTTGVGSTFLGWVW